MWRVTSNSVEGRAGKMKKQCKLKVDKKFLNTAKNQLTGQLNCNPAPRVH